MLDLRRNTDSADFFVTVEDIERYGQYVERLHDNPPFGKAINIETLLFDDEVAGYVVNFENGWQIVSSDKRGPVILAKSRKGIMTAASAW